MWRNRREIVHVMFFVLQFLYQMPKHGSVDRQFLCKDYQTVSTSDLDNHGLFFHYRVSQNFALGETFKLFYHETTLHKEHSEISIALNKVNNIPLNEIGMYNNFLLSQIITARSLVETISTEVI